MNQVARLSLVDRADAELSIVAQCRLLKVARSSLYWRPAAVSEDDLRLMPDRRVVFGDAVLWCSPHGGGAAPGRLDGQPGFLTLIEDWRLHCNFVRFVRDLRGAGRGRQS
jgi:hypothetical protein